MYTQSTTLPCINLLVASGGPVQSLDLGRSNCVPFVGTRTLEGLSYNGNLESCHTSDNLPYIYEIASATPGHWDHYHEPCRQRACTSGREKQSGVTEIRQLHRLPHPKSSPDTRTTTNLVAVETMSIDF